MSAPRLYGSRINQQCRSDISVLSVHSDRVFGFLCLFASAAAALYAALGRLAVSRSSLLRSVSAACRTVLAVAGKDFCVVASDTRLGLGYSIPSRKVSRILKMYVLASRWSWPGLGGSFSIVLCSAARLPMLSRSGGSPCDCCTVLGVPFFMIFVLAPVTGRTRSCLRLRECKQI